jgi:ComF family protein
MLARALNLLFPPQCLICNAIVGQNGALCLPCWQQVRFISDPICACCGLPFEYKMGEHVLCGECMRAMPPYARARSVFAYDEHSRALVLRLKYHDQTQLAPSYGGWLAAAGKELIAASDVIVPVPLHYWRFVKRRYNQSALLAQMLGQKTGLQVIPDALKRIRATTPQTGLTRKQREDNVKGAFTANPRHVSAVKGKTILLIDDVLTTGATLEHCSKALLKAGAMQVNVLTLARTVN